MERKANRIFSSQQRAIACSYFSLQVLATAVLLVSGCAYFRPSQTEAERQQEEQTVAEREYLKGTFIDDLVHAAGNTLNH